MGNFRQREKVSIRKVMNAAIEMAILGGNEVVKIRNKADLGERSKGKTLEGANDPVTDGDMLSHRVMFNGMRKAFPGLRIVSEEFEEYDGPSDAGVRLIVVLHVMPQPAIVIPIIEL